MKNNKFRRSLVAALAALAILIGFISTASIPASAKEYKVYKNDVTIKMFDTEWNEADFRTFWNEIYNNFGADVTIEMIKDIFQTPYAEELIRTGGPNYFVDCYFMQTWRSRNGLLVGACKFYIGNGWHEAEGWR